jgi:23S rRNA (guanine745-N1)-methyltransferase
VAKEGYINLLLAHQKKTAQPGDDISQLQGRRRFLQSGFYVELLTAIYALLALDGDCLLADVGCGEGYYTQGLHRLAAENGLVMRSCGIDIAKDGVRLAAKQNGGFNAQYGVASSFNLPWLDNSFDRVLRVFAPSKDEEIHRVLKDDGCFLVVSPGPRHLFELRSLLYQNVLEHSSPKAPLGFELLTQERVNFTMKLESSQSIDDLLLMTPFNWRGEHDLKQLLKNQSHLECEADFAMHLYKKCP